MNFTPGEWNQPRSSASGERRQLHEKPSANARRRQLDAGGVLPADYSHSRITNRMNTPADILLVTVTRVESLVVWAFNEGRGAALECDRYLMGRTDLP
jgi:glutamate synthase (NADPH) small chain